MRQDGEEYGRKKVGAKMEADERREGNREVIMGRRGAMPKRIAR